MNNKDIGKISKENIVQQMLRKDQELKDILNKNDPKSLSGDKTIKNAFAKLQEGLDLAQGFKLNSGLLDDALQAGIIKGILKTINEENALISEIIDSTSTRFGQPTVEGKTNLNAEIQEELKEKNSALEKIEAANRVLTNANHELEVRLQLSYLLQRLNERSHRFLLAPESQLLTKFEDKKPKNAFVVSFDIRRSTELMLKAISPKLYSEFLEALSSGLAKIIQNNYGVFDKFTGDGALAFFPDFYSGKNSAFNVIKSANEAHALFNKLYRDSRDSFSVILNDVGLGIGVDYGEVYLLQMSDGLTAVGNPVVYACRFSSGPAGRTFFNQQALKKVKELAINIEITEEKLVIKNEGTVNVSEIRLLDKEFTPALPDWLPKEIASSEFPRPGEG